MVSRSRSISAWPWRRLQLHSAVVAAETHQDTVLAVDSSIQPSMIQWSWELHHQKLGFNNLTFNPWKLGYGFKLGWNWTKWRSGGLSPAGTHKDRLDELTMIGPDLVASSTLCHAMFNCNFVGESCWFFSSSSFRICCFTMIRMVIWNRISPGDLPDFSNRQQSSQTKTA
jgi:hypothetical protein